MVRERREGSPIYEAAIPVDLCGSQWQMLWAPEGISYPQMKALRKSWEGEMIQVQRTSPFMAPMPPT